MDLQTLADRIEINDLLTTYATSVDNKDWAMYRTVFTPDAFIDYESAGGVKGTLDEVVAWMETTMAGFPMTQHLVANVGVELDGDAAKVRAMFYNPMQMDERQELLVRRLVQPRARAHARRVAQPAPDRGERLVRPDGRGVHRLTLTARAAASTG